MITFIGGGIRGLNQLTLEGLEALQSADLVLTFQNHPEFFQKHGIARVESLSALYVDGAQDEDNYARIVERIESWAAEVGQVAVLLPGHPRLGVTVTQRFEGRRDITVLPGISSFATMYNDLGMDPLERGSAVLDVNRVLLFGMPLIPEMDHYLYHVCSVGTAATHIGDASLDNAIELLKAKLMKHWPGSHRVTLIGSANHDGAPTRLEVALEDLEALLDSVNFNTTLFVPGVRPRSFDREYLRKLSGGREVAC